MEQQVEIQAQIHIEDGMYWAEVPSHPGLFASGVTLDELAEALTEAWVLYTQDNIASAEVEVKHWEVCAPKSPAKRSRRKKEQEPVVGRVDGLKLLVPA